MIYKPKGVCAQLLNLDIEDGIVKSVEFIGGCALKQYKNEQQ